MSLVLWSCIVVNLTAAGWHVKQARRWRRDTQPARDRLETATMELYETIRAMRGER